MNGHIMTVDKALSLARNLKYGPLPKKDDPVPGVNEAIEIIREERRTCGFNWLTGEAAEEVLRTAKKSVSAQGNGGHGRTEK